MGTIGKPLRSQGIDSPLSRCIPQPCHAIRNSDTRWNFFRSLQYEYNFTQFIKRDYPLPFYQAEPLGFRRIYRK